jgi:hypothetical protein
VLCIMVFDDCKCRNIPLFLLNFHSNIQKKVFFFKALSM